MRLPASAAGCPTDSAQGRGAQQRSESRRHAASLPAPPPCRCRTQHCMARRTHHHGRSTAQPTAQWQSRGRQGGASRHTWATISAGTRAQPYSHMCASICTQPARPARNPTEKPATEKTHAASPCPTHALSHGRLPPPKALVRLPIKIYLRVSINCRFLFLSFSFALQEPAPSLSLARAFSLSLTISHPPFLPVFARLGSPRSRLPRPTHVGACLLMDARKHTSRHPPPTLSGSVDVHVRWNRRPGRGSVCGDGTRHRRARAQTSAEGQRVHDCVVPCSESRPARCEQHDGMRVRAHTQHATGRTAQHKGGVWRSPRLSSVHREKRAGGCKAVV